MVSSTSPVTGSVTMISAFSLSLGSISTRSGAFRPVMEHWNMTSAAALIVTSLTIAYLPSPASSQCQPAISLGRSGTASDRPPYPSVRTFPPALVPRLCKICFGARIRTVPGSCGSWPVRIASIWYCMLKGVSGSNSRWISSRLGSPSLSGVTQESFRLRICLFWLGPSAYPTDKDNAPFTVMNSASRMSRRTTGRFVLLNIVISPSVIM